MKLKILFPLALICVMAIGVSCSKKKSPTEPVVSETIELQAPNGGEIIPISSRYAITWFSKNITRIKIEFAAAGGAWALVDTANAAAGSYQWNVPAVQSAGCRIRISDNADGLPADSSDQTFTIGGQWHNLSGGTCWPPRANFASVVRDNKIWVLGGAQTIGVFGPAYNDVWYSTDGSNWTPATSNALWSPRQGHAAVVFKDTLWLLGGNTNGQDTNDVWNSADGVTWRRVTAAAQWTGRSNFVALAFNGDLWVIGGRRLPDKVYNDVWYSSNGILWKQVSGTMSWTARCYHAGLVDDDRMWIIGGGATAKANIVLNDVWSSTDGSSWQQTTQHALWKARWGHGAVSFDNKIWLIGGDDSTNAGLDSTTRKNDMWYSVDGVTWIQAYATSPWAGRWGHSVAVLGQKIYVMGGYTGTVSNEIWAWP